MKNISLSRSNMKCYYKRIDKIHHNVKKNCRSRRNASSRRFTASLPPENFLNSPDRIGIKSIPLQG